MFSKCVTIHILFISHDFSLSEANFTTNSLFMMLDKCDTFHIQIISPECWLSVTYLMFVKSWLSVTYLMFTKYWLSVTCFTFKRISNNNKHNFCEWHSHELYNTCYKTRFGTLGGLANWIKWHIWHIQNWHRFHSVTHTGWPTQGITARETQPGKPS